MVRQHFADSGLQTDSIGEIYPWSVVIYKGKGRGIARLENLITGEKKTPHDFAEDFHDFEQAHNAAVAEVPTSGPDVPWKS